MSDTAIRRMTPPRCCWSAAIAAVVSLVHIEHLAATYGQTPLAAHLLPLRSAHLSIAQDRSKARPRHRGRCRGRCLAPPLERPEADHGA
jgi:hypothetical protein